MNASVDINLTGTTSAPTPELHRRPRYQPPRRSADHAHFLWRPDHPRQRSHRAIQRHRPSGMTNGGNFPFNSIIGSTAEQIVINTGSGTASLGSVSSPGVITNFIVTAGNVTFSGPITADNINITSSTTIFNTGSPVLLESPTNMLFNALGGNVGTLSSPIDVQTSGQVLVGAEGESQPISTEQQGTTPFIPFPPTLPVKSSSTASSSRIARLRHHHHRPLLHHRHHHRLLHLRLRHHPHPRTITTITLRKMETASPSQRQDLIPPPSTSRATTSGYPTSSTKGSSGGTFRSMSAPNKTSLSKRN